MEIKYSLQPRGLKSKLFYAFATFVISFGGALAIASPVDAAPGDVSCFVEVSPSASPSPSPSPIPSPVLSPTPCPSPSTTTVTVPGPVVTVPGPTRTVVQTQTVYSVEQVTVAQSAPPSSSPSASPSETATPVTVFRGTGDANDRLLARWAGGTVVVIGVLFVIITVVGMARSRRREGGRHRVDNTETMLMPAVDYEPEHDMADYGPDADYDPALGGHAGETYRDEEDDTKPLPPVE